MGTRYENQTGDVENYTPQCIIDTLHAVYKYGIDLDPASCLEADDRIHAKKWIGRTENGLNKVWIGPNIFVNPPYSRETIFQWASMATQAHLTFNNNVIWLSNNSTETIACQHILKAARKVCLPSSRMCFYNPTRPNNKNKAMQGQIIALLTRDELLAGMFDYHFSKHGVILNAG